MRELVLDTETTGLDPKTGDRIVEIGAVEVDNYVATGRVFHVYINPERSMPTAAFDVHGLSEEFLSDKPVFAAVAGDFLEFVADDKLVIHNAAFDMAFINMELERVGHRPIGPPRVVDTLQIARRKHPTGPNSLDALCSRYRIDNSRRTKHGALLDAELLAEVYLELRGGRQAGLGLQTISELSTERVTETDRMYAARQRPTSRRSVLDEATLVEHKKFVAAMGDAALWQRYWDSKTGDPASDADGGA
ncbi:MAG: DNA polymerase III subunit epsilon [Pseudomonadota bacterium]